jgi:Cytochrome c7 and related cytochrome c
MPQVFHPSVNTISRLSIVTAALAVPLIGVGGYAYNMSYGLNLRVPLEQPVQFSHKHHVGDDGIDCRYCHTSVEKAAFAGVPATEICMTCHSQIWTDSPLLQPVRQSWSNGRPIEWERVHDLPDFVYFNHSIHIKKGVSCVSCHGRVDEMPITWKEKTLSMRWCLDCHRNPEKNIRPRQQIYNLAWTPKTAEDRARVTPERNQKLLGTRQVQVGTDIYHVLSSFQMTNCSTCHH